MHKVFESSFNNIQPNGKAVYALCLVTCISPSPPPPILCPEAWKQFVSDEDIFVENVCTPCALSCHLLVKTFAKFFSVLSVTPALTDFFSTTRAIVH